MVYAENKKWQTVEHDLFASRYISKLVLHDYSGDELEIAAQEFIATQLTASPETAIANAVVDTNPSTGYLEVTATVESECEASALQTFCGRLLGELSKTDGDLECLTLVAAHVVFEEQLKQDIAAGLVESVADNYETDYLPTCEFDADDEQIMVDVRQIFYEARAVHV